MNRAEVLWGPTAKEFEPERWLEADSLTLTRAQEIQGHKHILTFSDGPRTCLGRSFALAEFKVRFKVSVHLAIVHCAVAWIAHWYDTFLFCSVRLSCRF